jgi:hypothetical protein
MATNTAATDVDDDGFDADDDRYDTLVLPLDVQQTIDQVRLFYMLLCIYRMKRCLMVSNQSLFCLYIDITKYRGNRSSGF